jgi:hypothetical protein
LRCVCTGNGSERERERETQTEIETKTTGKNALLFFLRRFEGITSQDLKTATNRCLLIE